MIRRLSAPLLLLAALLCFACAPDPPPAPAPTAPEVAIAEVPVPAKPAPVATPPTPPAPADATHLHGWWERPEALDSLGLTIAEGAALAPELRKLERSYQTAQRQLHTIRRTQLEMLRDPRVPGADIRRFNRENPRKLQASMGDDDIAARLWVREHLSADQRARLLERSPEFFGKRWFRAAKVAEPE
jgi:hypothetical protein